MVLTHKIISDSDTKFSEQWFEKAACQLDWIAARTTSSQWEAIMSSGEASLASG
jgi:hypothetical protein